MSLLEVTNLKKIYTTRFGGNKVQALNNVNFSVEKGEFVAIMGESGSGKTTLLNILATLDKPTSGDVLLDGKSLGHLSDKDRHDDLGNIHHVFQKRSVERLTGDFPQHFVFEMLYFGIEFSHINVLLIVIYFHYFPHFSQVFRKRFHQLQLHRGVDRKPLMRLIDGLPDEKGDGGRLDEQIIRPNVKKEVKHNNAKGNKLSITIKLI